MDFRRGDKLGQGSFGSVYQIWNQEGEEFVIKYNRRESDNSNEAQRLKALMDKGFTNFP